MIFEIIRGGGKTDWVGKEWAGLFFPRGKNGPAHSFPGEKTDWGEIPAFYSGITLYSKYKTKHEFGNGTSGAGFMLCYYYYYYYCPIKGRLTAKGNIFFVK